MGASLEPRPTRSEEYLSSQLKGPLVLRGGSFRLFLEPDGSVSRLESMAERRLLFGRESVQFCRVQAGGAALPARPEWRVSVSPSDMSFSSRPVEGVEVHQSVVVLPTSSVGYSRRVAIRNVGPLAVRVRVLSLQDPTTAHFRTRSFGWGSIGVNAFNRTSHVAMDEAADPPAARVVGSDPTPAKFYMTVDKRRALDCMQSCELPEHTAGMSGQVLVLCMHEFDLPPGGRTELTYVLLYNPAKLEDALSDFGSLSTPSSRPAGEGVLVASSSAGLTSGLNWATSGLEGVEYESDLLDRVETLRALPFMSSRAARAVVDSVKSASGSDGSVGHASNSRVPGVLETAVFLDGASRAALLSGDKKYMRALFPTLRRAANFLLSASPQGTVRLDRSLPQGWRRRIGRGYPFGEIPEVSLAVASAFGMIALLASRLGREGDSARFTERYEQVCSRVQTTMLDGRGALALCLDESGRILADETVDQAVACYRHPFDRRVATSLVQRLLEKDFATSYGPRTVPTSNRTWFNGSYGQGQLGGYWTRAALAYANLAYRLGFGGTGGILLESVGRLVSSESVRFGASPGVFPHWLDFERKEAHGGGDPVAAARYLEAVLTGELGLSLDSDGIAFRPSVSSGLKWLLLEGVVVGKRASAFLGRRGGRAFLFTGGADARVDGGWKHSGWSPARAEDARLAAVSFSGPGQVVCVANTSDSAASSKVSFRPQEKSLFKHLSVALQEMDPESGSWNRVSTVRVLPVTSFETTLGPSEWRVFGLSAG